MKKLIYIIILLIAHCTLIIEDCNSQWYQVNLPITSPIQRVQFVNQNTGWLILYNLNLLKTTNSGINWTVATDPSSRIFDFQFINDTLGYGMATNTSGANLLLKTTNGGYNWTTMQSSSNYALGGFYFVNADTGWVNAFTFPTQTTFMTTDGFQTLNPISTGAGGNPATMYFFKEPYNGNLCGYMHGAGYLWKTTNSGFNWTQLSFSNYINSFSFINKDTGWVVLDSSPRQILKTTNSGLNWNTQHSDPLGVLSPSTVFALNKNYILGGIENYYYKILISTNGGSNWGSQYCPIPLSQSVYMVDSLLGFSWNDFNSNNLVRTTNGGGTIIGINQIGTEVPEEYSLGQNYPNPFNSMCNVKFSMCNAGNVKLVVYDVQGREVQTLVNETLKSGTYETTFDASALATGIYFYQIIVTGESTHKTFSATKKMVLLK